MNKGLKYILKSAWIVAFAILILPGGVQAANRILIKTVASEEYVQQRAERDSDDIQTYNFFEGRFFGGSVKDRSLERFTFMDIVKDLAVHLQKQGYHNNPVVGEGDLLIVVHYGATDHEESFMDLMGYTSLEDMGYSDDMDASALAALEANISLSDAIHSANDQSRVAKSRLLGMEEAYLRSTPSHERETLEHYLSESRYFVILMAYDFPRLKQGETVLLWSTRYSIRSIGQPFDQAVKDMNLVAADYFGKSIDGLVKTRVTDKSRVKLGEIEVIETEPSEPGSPAKRP